MERFKKIKPLKRCIAINLMAMVLTIVVPGLAHAMESKPNATLFQNVTIFDGQHEKLGKGMSVLVEDNRIVKIGKSISAP